MHDTQWLRCGTLITGNEALQDVAVGLNGDRITDIRPWEDLPSAGRKASRDLRDAVVTPGFIDAHVHLLFTCEPNHEVARNRFETASTAALTATGIRNAQECLLGGVTTVRDCGDARGIVADIRDSQLQRETVGPHILAAGAPLTITGGHLHWCGNTVDGPAEIPRAVRQLCSSGSDLVKIMASGGNMTKESNPLVPQFTPDELRVAVQEAHRFGKHVAAHSQNAASIRACIEAGVDTLEHCLWRNPDGSPADAQELLELLSNTDTAVVITMAGIARVLLPEADTVDPAMLRTALHTSPTGRLSADFAWGRTLHDEGILVVVASDAGVRFTPFRDFRDSIHCTVEALGVSLAQAVAMSTSHAARAIGISDQVGTVAPGMVADLTVLEPSASPSKRLGAVRDVYQRGCLVVEDARLAV